LKEAASATLNGGLRTRTTGTPRWDRTFFFLHSRMRCIRPSRACQDLWYRSRPALLTDFLPGFRPAWPDRGCRVVVISDRPAGLWSVGSGPSCVETRAVLCRSVVPQTLGLSAGPGRQELYRTSCVDVVAWYAHSQFSIIACLTSYRLASSYPRTAMPLCPFYQCMRMFHRDARLFRPPLPRRGRLALYNDPLTALLTLSAKYCARQRTTSHNITPNATGSQDQRPTQPPFARPARQRLLQTGQFTHLDVRAVQSSHTDPPIPR
jgi:hypothetical protein